MNLLDVRSFASGCSRDMKSLEEIKQELTALEEDKKKEYENVKNLRMHLDKIGGKMEKHKSKLPSDWNMNVGFILYSISELEEKYKKEKEKQEKICEILGDNYTESYKMALIREKIESQKKIANDLNEKHKKESGTSSISVLQSKYDEVQCNIANSLRKLNRLRERVYMYKIIIYKLEKRDLYIDYALEHDIHYCLEDFQDIYDKCNKHWNETLIEKGCDIIELYEVPNILKFNLNQLQPFRLTKTRS